MKVFADAGAWVALATDTDRYHKAAVAYLERLASHRPRMLTSDYVLDEAVTRVRYDSGFGAAAKLLASLNASIDAGEVSIIRVDGDIWRSAEEIFLRYDDVPLSFTDCTSFAILNREPCNEVFGFDEHFEMMGHVLSPK